MRTLTLLLTHAPALDLASLRDAIDAACERHEVEARASLREYHIFRPMESLLAGLGLPSDPDGVAALADAWVDDWLARVWMVPGVERVLAALQAPKTVVSNTNTPGLVEQLCLNHGIAPHFDSYLTSIEHGLRKPHAEIYRAALRLAAVQPEDVLFVGDDAECDYFGPTAAGLRSVLISPRPVAGVPERDRIASILALPDWIAARC